MVKFISVVSAIIGIISAIFALVKYLFYPYFRQLYEYKEISALVKDRYERWNALGSSARGETMISRNDFIIINKYRSKFYRKSPEIRAYLLRTAIVNGLSGEWGCWLDMNKDNRKILFPLFLALNRSAGLRPQLRSALILEKIFLGNADKIDLYINKYQLYSILKEPIVNVIKTNSVEKEIMRLNNEGNKDEKEKSGFVIKEIEHFLENVIIFTKEQTIV